MAKNREIHKFYMKKRWKTTRNAYYEEKQGICERCKRVVGKKEYQVHHKEYLNADNVNDPSIALNFDNLELLCIECHNEEHKRFVKRKERVKFDANGEIIF